MSERGGHAGIGWHRTRRTHLLTASILTVSLLGTSSYAADGGRDGSGEIHDHDYIVVYADNADDTLGSSYAAESVSSEDGAGTGEQQAVPSLPGGASFLQETFQDWLVACGIVNKAMSCALSQQQRRKDDNKLALAIQLMSGPEDGWVRGILILPFGLELASGVKMQLDGNPATSALSFSTCLPMGCLVPLALDAPAVRALRSGSALRITAKTSGTGQDVVLAISLSGFSAALDRVVALGKP